MSYEQNKERLSSATRRDGYFSYVSTRDSEVQKTTLLSVDSQMLTMLTYGYPYSDGVESTMQNHPTISFDPWRTNNMQR